MRFEDFLVLALGALRSHRLRSILTATGIAVGIAAVILLTSIGAGIHRFVIAEFTQFGTNLIEINPGKAKTHGAAVGMFGIVRPLTIEDARALHHAPEVEAVVPIVQGNGEVRAAGRTRRTAVLGAGAAFPGVFRYRVALGRFLPADDEAAARPLAVLGSKLRSELFGEANPLGARIRIGNGRFVVVGVMEPKGQMLGFDLDDVVYIPAARSLELFNRESLMAIDLSYRAEAPVDRVVAGVERILRQRHAREDFTVTPQKQMLDTLGSVLDVLTFAVGALGGISLLVGGVGILTISTIAVSERTAEIGLMRALGARRGQVLLLFLGEAMLLAGIGGAAGLALGAGLGQVLRLALPALPVHTPWNFIALAEAAAIGIGLAAGLMPARRAARLDPVEALRAE
ncbi:MAG: ABC transporter permease [Rhodocyclaceae bacterium]